MSSEASLAQPKRLILGRDPQGFYYHELAGERLSPGALLLLQLADGTWLPGIYDWEQDASGPVATYNPNTPPLFRILLASWPDDGQRALTVEFYLPQDAVLRVNPLQRRLLSPRKPRARHK